MKKYVKCNVLCIERTLLLTFTFIFLTFSFSPFTSHFCFARGYVYWQENGIEVNPWSVSDIISDGKGGAITFTGDGDSIFAERVDGAGNLLWGNPGVVVDNSGFLQFGIRAVSDGKGGAIVSWVRQILPWAADIVCQRIDSLGNVMWGMGGVPICTADSGQGAQAIICDGVGGAIIAWEDKRNYGTNSWDIYAQHIDSIGTARWTINGMAICTRSTIDRYSKITTDGNGGAIIGWTGGGGWVQRVNDVPPGIAEEKTDTGGRMQDTRYALDIYPNPFQQTLGIKYSVGHSEKCLNLKICSVSGRLVKTLVNEVKVPGAYVVYWDGTDSNNKPLPRGVYFCILETEKDNFVKKILSMK